MGVARTTAVSLNGLVGTPIDVEADSSSGIPDLTIIGLGDTAVSQARLRVRTAASNAGCTLSRHKLMVNLSPASLPKYGASFDLAIAVASLAAAGSISKESVAKTAHIGELSLDGRLRPVSGVLPALLSLSKAGFDRVMVPAGNLEEAQLVSGLKIVAVNSLLDAAIAHGGKYKPAISEPLLPSLLGVSEAEQGSAPDLSEVIGQDDAIEALITAAAGNHHIFMLGPPGAGKTMLASRLPGILPDLDDEAALQVAALRSLSGLGAFRLERRPPMVAPHHTVTAAAMIGGGSAVIRPGAAVRACNGVLFLDEAPEFAANVLDCLRQPLETGSVTIHRARTSTTFPTRFQLVLAANPCPCGNYGASDTECVCPPQARRRYLARLSGPLMDRVDIRLTLPRLSRVPSGPQASSRSTESAKELVLGARDAACERLAGTPWHTNSELPGSWLRDSARKLGPNATKNLKRALEIGAITLRGYDRVLRVAWSVCDLAGKVAPDADSIGRALYFRRGIA